jgi:hypothetical protein
MSRIQVINETSQTDPGNWELYLQWGRYIYDDGSMEHGYRFIWKRPDGSLQPARGQARIPSLKVAQKLIEQAKSEGWGDYDAEVIDAT